MREQDLEVAHQVSVSLCDASRAEHQDFILSRLDHCRRVRLALAFGLALALVLARGAVGGLAAQIGRRFE